MPRARRAGFVRGYRYRNPTVGYRAGRAVARVPNQTVGSTSSQGIIVTSAIVVFGLGFLNSYIVPRKTPRIRLFMGVGLLYIGLSVIAQFNPKLARGFAVLVMLSALLAEGGGVMNWLMGRGTHDSANIFGGGTGTPNLPPMQPVSALTARPQFALPKVTPVPTPHKGTPFGGHR